MGRYWTMGHYYCLLGCLAVSVLAGYCTASQEASLGYDDGSPLSYANSLKNAKESLEAANLALKMERQNNAAANAQVDFSPALEARQQAQADIEKLKKMRPARDEQNMEKALLSNEFLKRVEDRVAKDVEMKVERKVEADLKRDSVPPAAPNVSPKPRKPQLSHSVSQQAKQELSKVSDEINAESAAATKTVKALKAKPEDFGKEAKKAQVKHEVEEFLQTDLVKESNVQNVAKLAKDKAAVQKAMHEVELAEANNP